VPGVWGLLDHAARVGAGNTPMSRSTGHVTATSHSGVPRDPPRVPALPPPAPPARAHRESDVGGTTCQKGFLSTRAFAYFPCGRSGRFGLGGCKEFEGSLGRDLNPGSRPYQDCAASRALKPVNFTTFTGVCFSSEGFVPAPSLDSGNQTVTQAN
jgi:hypothetical protein